MFHYGEDFWVCVSREGRGWESLGTDVHLIDSVEGLMKSHQLREQEDCYREVKDYI